MLELNLKGVQKGLCLVFTQILLLLAKCLQPDKMGFYPKYSNDESQSFRTVYRKLDLGEHCLSGSLDGKRTIRLMKVKERLRNTH